MHPSTHVRFCPAGPQVTHSQTMNQRMQQLAFTQGAGSLTVTAPPNPNAGACHMRARGD
jgi:hypothetical protein